MSRAGGKALGTIGDAGCFSFSPNKTITTGQGGAIVTNNEQLHNRLRELKDQGRPVRGTGGADTHVSIGFNFKFTNLQAAVGLGQLAELDHRIERMRAIHRGYLNGLQDVKGIQLFESKLEAGEVLQWVDAIVDRRDGLDAHLLSRGMQCRRFWFPLHTQNPYHRPDSDFPRASSLIPRAIWFPSAFTLSDDDVAAVTREIRGFANG
jgi:perosamine synthetase